MPALMVYLKVNLIFCSESFLSPTSNYTGMISRKVLTNINKFLSLTSRHKHVKILGKFFLS